MSKPFTDEENKILENLNPKNRDLFLMYREDIEDDELRLKEARLEVENAKKWVADSEGALSRSQDTMEKFKKELKLS